MDDRFDQLAKSVAGAVSRRETLLRLGRGLGLGVLAALGLGAKKEKELSCGQCCSIACRNLDVPPRGPEMGECIRACHETGIAVGPTGETSPVCLDACL